MAVTAARHRSAAERLDEEVADAPRASRALVTSKGRGTAAAKIAKAAYDPGLTDVDSRQIACMAEGHPWPRLWQRNGEVPKGIRYYPNHDDTYQRVDTCPCCTTERVKATLRGGASDPDQIYAYDYPEWWVHFHEADEMTRARLKLENDKRNAEIRKMLTASVSRQGRG
jgi:hypothetical protein